MYVTETRVMQYAAYQAQHGGPGANTEHLKEKGKSCPQLGKQTKGEIVPPSG